MKLFKKKKDVVFVSVAILITIILFFYVFFIVRYLSGQLRSAISTTGSGPTLPLRYDFDTLDRILRDREIPTP